MAAASPEPSRPLDFGRLGVVLSSSEYSRRAAQHTAAEPTLYVGGAGSGRGSADHPSVVGVAQNDGNVEALVARVPPTSLPTISHADLVELSTTVGSGSFGTVPLARWGDVTVALKKNKEGCADVGVMGNEVLLYAALHARPHPNILRVHGVCNDHPDGQQRLVMEYCEHGSLEVLLRGTQTSVGTLHVL
jgi:hypothetical protein